MAQSYPGSQNARRRQIVWPHHERHVAYGSDKMDGMRTAENAANRVIEQGRQVSEDEQVRRNFRGAVDKSLRDQPMATLAMAGVGRFRRPGRDLES